MPSSSPQQKLVDAVLLRASLDAAFRRELLAAPERAILDTFGVRLPDGVRVRFIEREPAWDAVYVLPDLQGEDEELSERELEAVAGGQDVYAWDGSGTPPK